MIKSIFRHNKRILATLCSAAILFSSFACLGASTVSAVTETPAEGLKTGVLRKTTYDFKSGSEYLDLKYGNYKNNHPDAKVEVTSETLEDGTTNNYLTLKANGWNHVMVNFPFELESNAKYRVSYKIKSETKDIKAQYATSGFFVGKSTGITDPAAESAWADGNIGNFKTTTKLADLYDNNGDGYTKAISSSKWTEKSYEFETGGSDVDNDFKYLCLNFVPTEVGLTNNYSTIGIDNLVIEKLDPNVGFYDFEEDVNVNWKFSGNNANDLVSLGTGTVDEKENHYLKLTKKNNWQDGVVVFPFELENGATYKVSYDYKVDKKFQARICLTASAATNGVLGESSGRGTPPSFKVLYESGWYVDRSDTTWTPVTNTITVGASDITDTLKYFAVYYSPITGTDSGYDTMYLDNVKIEKIVSLSFGDDAAAITGKPGSEVNLPTPTAKFGYTFNGWYDEENNLKGNAGATIICPDVDTTYYAKWVKNTSCNVNFEDGSYAPILSTGANAPKVADDPDGLGNKVLETNGAGANKESFYNFVLPVELEKDTYYTVSFRYKANLGATADKKNITLDITQGTAEKPSYAGSYVSLANSNGEIQQRLMRLLDGGSVDEIGNWDVNKVGNTDWKTCTYKIMANESSTFAMLNLVFYWGEPTDSAIYFDDISIQKTPTATFNTGDGATSINSITENPGTEITPGCPTLEGKRFMGWYVNAKYVGFDKLTMPNEDTTFIAKWVDQAAMGDVNMDGKVDDNDFVMLRKILLGINVGEYDAAAANCHDDGEKLTLDILDLVTLKNALAAAQ